jgi:dTDP-4-dehydrorhamnose reductase
MGADTAVVQAVQSGQTMSLFTDEIRTPVHVDFVAPMFEKIARERRGGIFHLAGAQAVSRFDLGRRACEAAGIKPNFQASLAADFDGPPRSLRLELDCGRAIKELGWQPPDLRQSLDRTFATPVRTVAKD